MLSKDCKEYIFCAPKYTSLFRRTLVLLNVIILIYNNIARIQVNIFHEQQNERRTYASGIMEIFQMVNILYVFQIENKVFTKLLMSLWAQCGEPQMVL